MHPEPLKYTFFKRIRSIFHALLRNRKGADLESTQSFKQVRERNDDNITIPVCITLRNVHLYETKQTQYLVAHAENG